MILGITGTNGAGKGVVVDYLKTKGFVHYSSRDYLARELARRGLDETRPNLRALGNEFRQTFGSGYLVEHFLGEIRKAGVKDAVIESLRSSGEAEALKKAGGILMVIDADRTIRYDRIVARKSGTDLLDFNTFVEQEERERYGTEGAYDMNIQSVIEMADYTIFNDGSISELHAKINAVLEQLKNV